MTKIEYVPKKFHRSSLEIIEKANEIIVEYEAAGFVLTLRQLFYQFVSRNFIANKQQNYKRLGEILNDARLAGLVSWDAIEDRTRSLRSRPHWAGPAGVIESAAASYGRDLWKGQDTRCEVWIEKDALVGVIERVCAAWDVPYFSCRGYASQSEVWRAGQRHIAYGCAAVTVIHLGDHDPSGMDMTRDIQDRLRVFGAPSTIRRIALNSDQTAGLPPNPAKMTDSRFAGYADKHGESSWELDALDPKKIERMVEKAVKTELEDPDEWTRLRDLQEAERKDLTEAADRWDEVQDFLS